MRDLSNMIRLMPFAKISKQATSKTEVTYNPDVLQTLKFSILFLSYNSASNRALLNKNPSIFPGEWRVKSGKHFRNTPIFLLKQGHWSRKLLKNRLIPCLNILAHSHILLNYSCCRHTNNFIQWEEGAGEEEGFVDLHRGKNPRSREIGD